MVNNQGKKLPRQVKALGLVSFFNDTASEMIYPLLPAFVSSVLGLGPQVLGIMEGIAEAAASLLKYFSGWWSDRIRKRKPLAVIGYSLSSALRPFMGLAMRAWHVVLLRAFDRVGKGIRTSPRDALLAASVDPGIRGKAFGFHRAMDHAGAVAGPVIALVLLSGFGLNLRTLFLLTAVPALVTVVLIMCAVREIPVSPESPSADDTCTAGTGGEPYDRRAFGIFLVSMVLFTLGNSTDIFLVLHAHELGVPVSLAPVIWIVLHLSKTACATPGGALSDRIGRKKTILLGWGVYSVSYAGFASADAAWQIWPLFALYGLFYGLTEGPEKALTADLVPPRHCGRAFGLYHLSVGIAALPASVVAGYAWKYYGAYAALGLGALLAAIAAAVLAVGLPSRAPGPPPSPSPKQ